MVQKRVPRTQQTHHKLVSSAKMPSTPFLEPKMNPQIPSRPYFGPKIMPIQSIINWVRVPRCLPTLFGAQNDPWRTRAPCVGTLKVRQPSSKSLQSLSTRTITKGKNTFWYRASNVTHCLRWDNEAYVFSPFLRLHRQTQNEAGVLKVAAGSKQQDDQYRQGFVWV